MHLFCNFYAKIYICKDIAYSKSEVYALYMYKHKDNQETLFTKNMSIKITYVC